MIEACKSYNVKLIVLTHAHFDHAENAAKISDLLGIPIGMNARIISLPGHTDGSIGIDVDSNHLIVGDALMNMFYPTVSMLYHNRDSMLESAGKISSIGDRTIYFGHGKPVTNKQWVK